MAIDEVLLESRIEGLAPNTVRLYQWAPSTVTIGRHQSLSLEVDLEELDKRGYQVVRRISGGGAVLHAEGKEITYSVVVARKDLACILGKKAPSIDDVYGFIMRAIQETLSTLALKTERGKIGCPALFLDGKKFSGNAQCIKRNVFLQHGTILLGVDPGVMYSVLKPPEGVEQSKMVRSVKAKVTGIGHNMRSKVTLATFASAFKKSMEHQVGAAFIDGCLSEREKTRVRDLKKKYASREWSMRYP